MLNSRTLLWTALAMTAFAANSILCRMALAETAIDAASFTALRLLSGALVLAILVRGIRKAEAARGNWPAAFALFVYAATFSFAYTRLSTGTGALLLFGAVQSSMILWGWFQGERPRARQVLGIVAALCGLIGLLLPGLSAPAPLAATSMLVAGLAWGIYSLLGRGAGNPLATTAGNFLRAAPFALLLSAALGSSARWDARGAWLALISGALTSGLGYAVWYHALKQLDATRAACVQLSVPVLAALGGVLLLDETLSLRLGLASATILGGIALVIAPTTRSAKAAAKLP